MNGLDILHEKAHWPSRKEIFSPNGGGPSVYCDLVRKKIEFPLRREFNIEISTGVVVADANSDTSDIPLAIICNFPAAITPEILRKTRNLAWNFCQANTLLTIEPQLVRIWSCFESPNVTGEFTTNAILTASLKQGKLPVSFIRDLQWLEFASGIFFEKYASRFPRDKRADFQLLSNLKEVRNHLLADIEDIGVAHDLLARIIFIQFLFDRKDSNGKAALNETLLEELHQRGILKQKHNCLASILKYKEDVFSLFSWLNDIANGDLFAGNYDSERRLISTANLSYLSDFISGELEMKSGQMFLWPQYSFDTIPLEFVSSIYEEFVTGGKIGTTGEHYTRPFLVDFLLDKVLPWSGSDYNLKILDPCCGSAVFLVKAYQRLVHRWKNCHCGEKISIPQLCSFLKNNLWGFDTNENAIRVASFSLYLALCDEIDPKEYLNSLHFPKLRGKTLLYLDFFLEDESFNILTSFDLVIGNAPWGKKTISQAAIDWAKANKWPFENDQIGSLFLAKALTACKPSGHVCMIQSESALLSNGTKKVLAFRKKLFSMYKVYEIVNLALLRQSSLFPNAVSPCCIIKLSSCKPDTIPIAYWYAKTIESYEQKIQRIILSEYDLNWIWPEEAATDPDIWYCLSIGGRSDYNFIKRLKRKFSSIADYIRNRTLFSSTGMFRGKDIIEYPETVNRPIVDKTVSWNDLPNICSCSAFPLNANPLWGKDSKRDAIFFESPLLLTKETWSATTGRFKAVLIVPDDVHKNIVFTKQHICIKPAKSQFNDLLKFICELVNSKFAVYYLFATCGRLASYIPTVCKNDLLDLPLPKPEDIESFDLSNPFLSDVELDKNINKMFNLSAAELALIDDFFDYFLAQKSATFQKRLNDKLLWNNNFKSGILEQYAKWLMESLCDLYGNDKKMCVSIFSGSHTKNSSLTILALHFNISNDAEIRYLNVPDVYNIISSFSATEKASIAYKRMARIYSKYECVPTIFLVKPNNPIYWTRSVALRDSEAIISDFMLSVEENG